MSGFQNAVRKQMEKAGIAQPKNDDNKWGRKTVLQKVDLKALSRAHLKSHLGAREETAIGNKKQLVDRLAYSLEEEKLKFVAYEEEIEAKHRRIATKEEKGAVYVVGSNHMGQLGLGDLDHRTVFTVLPITRGLNVSYVTSGYNVSFAVTQDHNVYTWGGRGIGIVTGIKSSSDVCKTPRIIDELGEEEIVSITAGANHACAMSEDGDCFVWGNGQYGVLGLGDFCRREKPELMGSFGKNDVIKSVVSGEYHTCALTEKGEVYAWGHASSGRLGVGNKVRVGVPDQKKRYILDPSLVILKEAVTKIACGTEHTLVVTSSRVYSWGSGDGGRLGHGSFSDRFEPEPIKALDNWNIIDISAGTWHSACVVRVPPLKDSGWVYTWGSGYHGQLGKDDVTVSPLPALVSDFCTTQISIKTICCGSHHNAAITSDNELYTWGSNSNGCLGRSIDEKYVSFTTHPGHCGGFGAIVNRIGRGLVRSVACGKEFTIVATFSYKGPTEEKARRLMEKERLKWSEEQRQKEEERQRIEFESQQKREMEQKMKEVMFLTSKRLCSIDPNCPGFQVHALKPSICKECGHSVTYHTIIPDDEDEAENTRDTHNEGVNSSPSLNKKAS